MSTEQMMFLTPQRPLPSGFGPRTTAEEVIAGMDLTGKTAIVTGGYSGLGLEVSRTLAEAGAHVVIPARTMEKAQAAIASIPDAELAELDLADPASIDRFARSFLDSGRPLHLLILNAGIMAIPEQRDARGYELQFVTNHLGHFQLTARLWPALALARGARVIAVSSGGHKLGDIQWDDPNFIRQPYEKWKAYGQSKTAGALFAVELDRRGQAQQVRAFSVHPGSIVTNLSRFLSDDEMDAMGALDHEGKRGYTELNDERKTIPEGAATIVWCAVSPQLDGKGGVYCQNADIASPISPEQLPLPGAAGVCPWAMDPEAARRLWRLSEELTGVSFDV
ncbi:oxidoreductase [Paenibacillus sp. NFR01]|uniref:oxidoreductase n=1 Tax=Paenibacillus sp. NFR01 TaxID=1566279 RepID=UPI0008B6FB93|nr:oxidoreductase [Paenibacillus sp. NFR01]SET14079.1 NAD(P)-dependent dehydrogenase, short-chain alcohol dehydrogenase family [Paenibacillus sp. NFR01]